MKRTIIIIMLLLVTISAWGQWIEDVQVNPFDETTSVILVKPADGNTISGKVLVIGFRMDGGVQDMHLFVHMGYKVVKETARVRFGEKPARYIKGTKSSTSLILPEGTLYELLDVGNFIIQIDDDILIFDLRGLKELCVKYGLTDKKNPNYYLD